MTSANGQHAQYLSRREEIEAPPDPADYSAFVRLVSNPDNRLVVSFGGGATPGLCGNLALARLLEELNLRQHVAEVWGTSAGAVVGGGWATGSDALEVLRLVQSLDRRGAIDFCLWKMFVSLVLRPLGRALPDGVILGRQFAATTDAGLRVKSFEECPTPFRCIAVADDGSNRRKVFRKGPLLPAIFSSMSLPGIVVPRSRQTDEECGYYDGGLVEKTPLISPIGDHLRSGDRRRLLLLATHFRGNSRRLPARGFIARFIQTIYALEEVLWEYQLEEARRRYKQKADLLMVNPQLDNDSLFDFSRSLGYYLQARENFKEALQNGSLALTFGRS
jgi:predicted acylesterase/phospholipase RssA